MMSYAMGQPNAIHIASGGSIVDAMPANAKAKSIATGSSGRRRARRREQNKSDPHAKLYDEISFRDVILEDLKVIDQTAITLCRENALPLVVLNIHRPGAIVATVRGERVGTLVR